MCFIFPSPHGSFYYLGILGSGLIISQYRFYLCIYVFIFEFYCSSTVLCAVYILNPEICIFVLVPVGHSVSILLNE